MKTTIDIPDDILLDAMKHTRARTKRDAVVMAMTDFNRRQRMAALVRHAGTCESMISHEALIQLRQQG